MGIEAVKFRGRHVSVRALIFLITGGMTILLLAVLPFVSAFSTGEIKWFGIAGIAAAILNIIGLIESVKALSERDTYEKVAIAGMVVNGVSLVAYIVIYVLGLV